MSCHHQKFSDDSAIVGCINGQQEAEYRGLVDSFIEWCSLNHLWLNVSKTKELVVDFCRIKPTLTPVSIHHLSYEVELS